MTSKLNIAGVLVTLVSLTAVQASANDIFLEQWGW